MEKRALLAVVLSIAVLIIYQQWVRYYYGPQPAPVSKQKRRSARESRPPKPRSEIQQSEAPPVRIGSGTKDIRVETDHYVAVFTNLGARLKSFRLKHYRNSPDKSSGPVEMVFPGAGGSYPLGVELKGREAFSDKALVYAVQGSDLTLSGDARGEILFRGVIPHGETIGKRYSFSASDYAIGIEVSLEGAKDLSLPRLLLTSSARAPTKGATFEGMLALADNKLVRESPKRLMSGADLEGEFSWLGFGYTYFLMALLPDAGGEEAVAMRQSDGNVTMSLERQDGAGTEGKVRYTLFIGPKDLDVLRSMGKGLERSIDFGYFSFVSVPLHHVLRFSHRITSSYGIDIILLTVLIKLLLAPLTHRSYVSMRRMKMLQPQMERIKEKFKDDKERLRREIMGLYRRNKVNPLGGCLPMLLQMPVLAGLYRTLRTPIELRHAPFLWIKDLSRPDWQSLPLTLAGWKFGIPILTLLMGASMFAQQWMTPTAQDPNQRQLALVTPVLFTVMFINFPAGLTIYWLANNLLTIGQQYLINRLDH